MNEGSIKTAVNTLESGDYSSSLNRVVLEEIRNKSHVLDVGCWIGNLGQEIINTKKCTVEGIDFREDVLKVAQERGYEKTHCINLNGEKINFGQIDSKFDYIVFADVLEHLVNPELILTELQSKLKPKGKIIVSLPNVAFALNRLNLLLGRWNYKNFGTLDKTHLRFFTISTGVQLIEKSGYKVKKVKPYNQFGILKHLYPLDKVLPGLLCYQFLITASKND